MKRSIKIAAAVVIIALLGVLVFVNRRNASQNDALAAGLQLEIESPSGSQVYAFDENSPEFTGFDTQMKRKNGDVFDRHYAGIEFAQILKELGQDLTESTECTFVCADQYEITVSGAELMDPGNVYLVTREDDQPLSDDQGPFMLVINRDEFSTRWGKQIVKVVIRE